MATLTETRDAIEIEDLPKSDIDPYAAEILRWPYDAYAELRRLGPAVYLTRYDVVCFARYREVYEALRDWHPFMSGAGVGLADLRKEEKFRPRSLLLEVDPPVHEKTRTVMNKVLSMPAVNRMRETFAQEADRMIDRLVARGEFDAVKDLAEPFVLKVFPDAVGLPEQGRENLLPWGDMAFNSFGPNNERFQRSAENAKRVIDYVMSTSTRAALVNDGFGRELYAMVDKGRLEEDEAGVLVRSMMTAGLDTTVTGLSASVYAFASHPDQWDKVRADPKLVRPAFEEVVRWAGPVQTFFRTVAEDTEFAGVRLPKDRKILLIMAAANRDPDVYENPETLDVTRDARGQVGFGHGIHKCVGQMVAKLEAEVMYQAMAKRIARFEFTGDVAYHLNNTVRSFSSIPVRVVPA